MYCTKCGIELREDDRFCSRCGNQIGAGTADAAAPRTLLLDKQNKKIAGVCAGFARYFDVDVVLMRVLWIAVALCTGGLGFFVYLAAWIVIPSDAGLATREMMPRVTQTT
jgi:phage shock protein C